MTVPAEEQGGAPAKNAEGGEDLSALLKGAEKADTWAKQTAFWGMLAILAWCLFLAGHLSWSRGIPFQGDANFALFAVFVVVAGAIERLVEPMLVYLPPNEQAAAASAEEADKKKVEVQNEKIRADRTLLAYVIALAIGVAVSSLFGLYFMEAIGVKLGSVVGSGKTETWEFFSAGGKWLRGLDIFITALIITGGTKPLHDMITSIEKKKEEAAKKAASA